MKLIGLTRLCALGAVFLAGCGSPTGFGSNEAGGAEARGQVTRADKAAGTFVIQPLVEWRGFVPSGDSVNVATDSQTRFWDRGGNETTASAWFDYVTLNLAPSTAARVNGSYSNGTIEADEVRLE